MAVARKESTGGGGGLFGLAIKEREKKERKGKEGKSLHFGKVAYLGKLNPYCNSRESFCGVHDVLLLQRAGGGPGES